jgi:predicted O-linked N-acetylglucosamine transferase (SPINDLY family)
VLVDLVGYTGGGEKANEVFASSPAPHQISYMVWPMPLPESSMCYCITVDSHDTLTCCCLCNLPMAWLQGFCASTGAPYMHHLVSDKVASPPEYRSQFSEHLMLMPHSYFVNDHRSVRTCSLKA